MNLQYNDTDDYVTEGYNPLVSQECVGNNHSNQNEIVSLHTSELKYVHSYAQEFIAYYRI